MLISVVLPNFNHGEFLHEAVVAIAEQSVAPDEIIIIDDGSTDNSREVIEALARRYDTIKTIFFTENRGTHSAVLAGREQARGEYIYFAAADDRVLPGFFEKSLDILQANPSASFCTARSGRMDLSGKPDAEIEVLLPIEKASALSPNQVETILFKRGSWFRCNTAIYRRSIIEELGGFDMRLGPFADGFACMMLALRDGCCFVPEKLGITRTSPSNFSSRMERDVIASSRMFNYANHLMHTQFASIFPSKVIRRWDGRWRYTLAQKIIRKRNADKTDQILTLLPGASPVDRLVCRMAGFLPEIVQRFYFLLRLAPWDCRTAIVNQLMLKTRQ